MKFNEILAEIIIEVGGDITDVEFGNKILIFIKTGIRRIPAFIRDRLFVAEDTATLTSGTNTIDLDDLDPGFVRERVVWYESSGKRVIINRAKNVEWFHSLYNSNSSGKPFCYLIQGSTIKFDKLSDENLTVGFDYVAELSETGQLLLEGGGLVLSEDGGHINLTADEEFFGHEQLVEAVKDFAKMIYYRDYEEDEEKAREHERMGKEIIQRLEEEYEIQELGGHI